MNKPSYYFFVASLILPTPWIAIASAQKPQQKVIPFSQAKKKTIGELLRQADRGAGLTLVKGDTAISSGNDLFEANKKRVDLSQVKPPRTQTFYNNQEDQDSVQLEKLTDQQINELFKLTQRLRDSPQRGELWLRLAELYVEKAAIIDYRKQNEYDKKLQAYQSGKIKERPRLNLADAKEYNKKAIQLYEWFIRDFPRDQKLPQALFFLGFNYFEIGQLQKGTGFYEKLTKEFPKSSFVTEAYFALAEYYFENDKFSQAGPKYDQVLKYPRHRLYGFSLYKSAWVDYRLGRGSIALNKLEKLVKFSRDLDARADLEGRRSINKNRLESEALRDMVLFYSDVGAPQNAVTYFERITKDSTAYIEKLAYFYADKGNANGARILFNHLIAQDPNSAKAFDYKYQIVKLFSANKKSREFREELYSWVKGFAVESEWYKVNKDNSELIQNSEKLRENTLKNHILRTHQTAQNSRAPFSQNLAVEGYRIYLAEFQSSPSVGDMTFYFGELLYDLKRFDEAADKYKWVVDNAPTSKFAGKAAENIILVLEKDLPTDAEIERRVGKTETPVEMDVRALKFIEGSKAFLMRFPKHEKAIDVKFKAARLYYQHNYFDQAIPLFREIVTLAPKSKPGEFSANLLLDAYNLKKDYAGLEAAAGEMLANPEISKAKSGEEIRQVLERSSFKKAQDLEVEKKFADAAVQFELFSLQNPTSQLVTASRFNAAINFERANQVQKAIENHMIVIRSSDPKAESSKKKSRQIMAKLLQDSGRLEEAAQAYRNAAVTDEKDPLAANFHFNAAVLFDSLGRKQDAINSYERYFALSKRRDRFEVLYTLGKIYESRNGLTKASELFEQFVNARAGTVEQRIEASFLNYKIFTRLKKNQLAENWKRTTLNLQRAAAPDRRGPGASYAAQLRLEDVRVAFEEFRAIRIPANPQRQQEAVQKKIAAITRLNGLLTEIVRYDSPSEIVSALYLSGETNHQMARALIAAPIPSELKGAEIQQYREGIRGVAEPFQKKAEEALKASIEKGKEFETYPEDYRKARATLDEINTQILKDVGEVHRPVEIEFEVVK